MPDAPEIFNFFEFSYTVLNTMPVPPPPGAKLVYEGKLAKAYAAPQTMYDGSVRTFEYYVRPDTVAVIAFLDRDTVLLTKQEQPGRTQPFLDPPGGMVDPGESPETAALRELEEETGYRARRIELWSTNRFEGITRFEEFMYIATDLEPSADHNPEAAGEKIELLKASWAEAVDFSLKNRMRRNECMLAILGMQFDPEQRNRLDAFLSGA